MDYKFKYPLFKIFNKVSSTPNRNLHKYYKSVTNIAIHKY